MSGKKKKAAAEDPDAKIGSETNPNQPSTSTPSKPRQNAAYEETRDMLIFAADAMVAVSEATDLLAPLKSTGLLLKKMLETTRAANKNKEAWKSLGRRLSSQLNTLETYQKRVEGKPCNSDLSPIGALRGYTMQEVAQEIQSSEERAKSTWRRITRMTVDAEGIREWTRSVDEAYQDFMVAMSLLHYEQASEQKNMLISIDNRLEDITEPRGSKFSSLDTEATILRQAYGIDLDLCHKGTRTAILEVIRSWASRNEDTRQIFWLSDIAGTGKSTIAATLAEHWIDSGQLAGRFFFSPNSTATSSTKEFCFILAKDMMDQIPALRNSIEPIVKEPSTTRLRIQQQFRRLIADPLKSYNQATIFVFDALDNCDLEDHQGLLNLLLEQLPNIPKVKALITSRPVPSIKYILQGSPLVTGSNFQLYDIRDQGINSDILAYVDENYYVRHLTSAQRRQLALQSGGLFVWAATACRMFQKNRKQPELLKLLLSPTTAKNLDGLYLGILQQARAPPHAHKEFMEILQMVIISLEPISISMIQVFLPSNQFVAEVIEDLCSLMKDGTVNRPIRILHPTFREFLSEVSRANGFAIEPTLSHALILNGCFLVLKTHLGYDITNTRTYSTRLDIYSHQSRDGWLAGLALSTVDTLRYAMKYWPYHASRCLPVTESVRLLRDFLQQNLLNWIELLVLFEMLGAGTSGLAQLAEEVKSITVQGNEAMSKEDIQWTKDALKFIQSCQIMGGKHPLHIYRSVLGFTSPQSKVYQAYIQKYHDKVPKLIGEFPYREEQGSYAQLGGHLAMPVLFEFSSNGERIVSSEAGVAYMWETISGTRLRPEAPDGEFHGLSLIFVLQFSPDGTRIFTNSTGSHRNSIITWNAETFSLMNTRFDGHTAQLSSLLISEDGNWMISGSEDRSIILWNLQSGRRQGDPLVGHSNEVNHLAFSIGNQYIVSTAKNELAIWRTFQGTPLRDPVKLQEGSVIVLKPLSHQDHVATCSEDGIFSVTNIQSGHVAQIAMSNSSGLYDGCVFSSDSSRAACCSKKGDITIVNIDGDQKPILHSVLSTNTEYIRLLQFLPEPNTLLSLSLVGQLTKWDVMSGETTLQKNVSQGGRIFNARLSPDCKLIAINEVLRKDIMLWKLEDLLEAEETSFGQSGRAIQCLDLSTSQTTVASGSEDGSICLWDTKTVDRRTMQGKHKGSVELVTFSPNDSLVASLGSDKTINLWNVNDGTTFCSPLQDSEGFVKCVRFSPDGRWLFTITGHRIHVWSISSPPEIQFRLVGHEDAVNSVVCSADSQSLFSASRDGTVKQWSLVTGEELHTNLLEGHLHRPSTILHYPKTLVYYPSYLTISPDGNRLACISEASSNSQVDCWDIRPAIVHVGCERSTSRLSPLVFSRSGRFLYGQNEMEVLNVMSQDLLRDPASRPEDHHPRSNLYVKPSQRWIHKFHPKHEQLLRIKDGFLITSWLCFNNTVVIGGSTGSVYMIDCDSVV
ncbi:WD40 repeat-like protein [Serendipita vermifera]|nr:WD40 repeat-like protein [Serendipita vermifera]